MHECINLNIRDFSYIFLEQELAVFVDRVYPNKEYKKGNYLKLTYEAECPDCEDDNKLVIAPILRMYKIIDTDIVKFKDLSYHSKISEDNLEIIKNDISLRYKDLKDNDDIVLIICKN